MKKIISILTLLIISITIISTLSSEKEPNYNLRYPEVFDQKLMHISTLYELDSIVYAFFQDTHQDTVATVNFIDDLLRKRFHHGYSELSFKDNWIAFLLGKLVWQDFLYLVRPEDIIKHTEAACSQQGMLFQDQLQKLGIRFATIAFYPTEQSSAGHYGVSVHYNNKWHFYDSNQEPTIDYKKENPAVEEIASEKLYEQMYHKDYHKSTQDFFITHNFERINENKIPAKRMRFLHTITSFLSNWLWLLLIISLITCFLNKKSS